MRRAQATRTACLLLTLSFIATRSFAQAPAEPPPIWTIIASAGLALTSGNSDTISTNVAYDITYDPHQRNLVKSEGLFLRARTEGELTANRLGFNVRDQYRLTQRLYVFGQNQYLRDEFKEIDYLLAPTAGSATSCSTPRQPSSMSTAAPVASGRKIPASMSTPQARWPREKS